MKPCVRNRKSIALLAAGALEPGAARGLRAHLQRCSGCSAYLSEISSVATALQAAQPDSDIRATESFHRITVAAIKMSHVKAGARSIAEIVRSLFNWRVALPAAAAVALVIAMLSRTPQQHPAVLNPAHAPTAVSIRRDLAPTVANYEMVANQSLEKLDELISRQGNRDASRAPLYTASAFSSWVAAD